MAHSIVELQQQAIGLLKKLIQTQSFSKEEHDTHALLTDFLTEKGIPFSSVQYNIWAKNQYFDDAKPTILLNSHHDTVKPNKGYTRDPFLPSIEDGKLYGLGSNDAGGCLVSLLVAFVFFYDKKDLAYNIIFAASAEEEISGKGGIELLYPDLPKIDCAIVGEPTLLDAAIAEKGLLVIDATAEGKAGHAARDEGVNALYKAVDDIQWIKNYSFDKVSPYLGNTKMTVTILNGGSQHNVVPKECVFTIDIRLTECYSHEEVIGLLEEKLTSKVKARSTRIKPSFIKESHPLVKAAVKYGAKTYGSPTTSDQALIPATSLKMGPGDSARSHMADEYIYLKEIEEGVQRYIDVLSELV
ncbi:MAG: M20 family metallo-hydrolase [Cyclobacteriaceae bacterium]